MMQPSFQFSGPPMSTGTLSYFRLVLHNKEPGPNRRQRRRNMFGNIFLGRVRGHWRDFGGGFTFAIPFVCVYAVAFAQQCMSMKCSV